MDDQTQCALLYDLPLLPLLVLWEHVLKLQQADAWALLATCKKALVIFGRLTDRTVKLKLTLRTAHGENETRGDASLPLEILSRFRHAGLELKFASINAAPIQLDLLGFIGKTQTLDLGNVTSLDLAYRPWMGQQAQARISTDDMTVVAAKLPSIQRLRLACMDVMPGLWHEPLSRLARLHTLTIVAGLTLPDSFLSSLSRLERLSCLGIDLMEEIDDYLGRVVQHLQHVSSLASLSLKGDFNAGHLKLSTLSCLWGLQHLTRLSFILRNEGSYYSEVDGEVIAGLVGCKLLTSLELPWGAFENGLVEQLAVELTRLTHLSVHSMRPLGPMTASCSWKELTLNSLYQYLRDLLLLPVANIDRVFLKHEYYMYETRATVFAPEADNFEAFLGLMELRAPQLATAMLRANTRLLHLFDLQTLPRHALQERSAVLRLITALKPLGPFVESLTLPDSMAGHVDQLAEAFPELIFCRMSFDCMTLSRGTEWPNCH